jgi:hypothetical protein
MKDIKKEIADLKARIQELENQIAEPVKWQPIGGDWYINGECCIYKSCIGSTEKSRQFGTERPTKEQAERAAVEMRKFNRLLALRDELCEDDVVDWNISATKYYLAYCNSQKEWYVEHTVVTQYCTPYFTTDESAQRACDMLNSGEVELL